MVNPSASTYFCPRLYLSSRSEPESDTSPDTVSRLMPEKEPVFEELLPSPALRLDVPAVLQTDLARVRFTGTNVSFDDTFMFQVRILPH